MVPHAQLATSIAKLADRVVKAGKELHIILSGCNTQNLEPVLHKEVAADQRAHVYVQCTSVVWPSDLAPF